jgi:UDP-glucose 4-epimerase
MNDPESFYEGRTCIVTGGASFIGSHLVDRLMEHCAKVIVIDDLSSGRLEHLAEHADSDRLDVRVGDLKYLSFAEEAIETADVLFHLAAVHGGRGFIEQHGAEMMVNLTIDQNVMACSAASGIEMVVQASSACAYPLSLQEDPEGRSLLQESTAGFETPGQSFPDGTYGWLKLMGEYQVKVPSEAHAFRGRSARIFTAYGERENESHAAIALIAKALLRMDPYPVWGTGLQTRNFTHVSDTVHGILLLGADRSELAYDVFNVGSSRHHTILDFLDAVFDAVGWRPSTIEKQMHFPTGVANRAADNTKLLAAFGWEPERDIQEGVHRTVEWYRGLPERVRTLDQLESRLSAR